MCSNGQTDGWKSRRTTAFTTIRSSVSMVNLMLIMRLIEYQKIAQSVFKFTIIWPVEFEIIRCLSNVSVK